MSDRGHTFGAPVGSGLGSPPIQVMMQNPFNLSDLQMAIIMCPASSTGFCDD